MPARARSRVSSSVSSRSGCANKYARSHESVNISKSSAFMRGDGTCSVVSRSIAAVKALLSSTGLFHHGDVGNRSVIVGVNLEQNAKLVALEVVLNHSVTTLLMALLLLVTGCIAQVEAAPGNIRLLPGYVHRRAQGIDSMVGSISQKERKNGLVIHYDIGRLAGVYAECSDCGWTDGEIRHRSSLLAGIQ